MSITPALKAAARSTYRNLYRAASTTFAGDEPVLTAFRQKMRDDALNARSLTNPEEYQQHIQLNKDIAVFLRRNIVQGVKVAETGQDGRETWHLKVNENTELGDNESIKNPKPMVSNRSTRKRQTCPSDVVLPEPTPSPSPRPLYYSALKKAHQKRAVPELREDDLEESFVRGSGPGGQSINKTENNVQLLHRPTGIRVTCQETRSLAQNRKIARKLILDQMANPGLSKEEMKRARQIERERRRRKKAKKKSHLKENVASEKDD
ncbi:hypothetical protein P691DRAFT_697559 [Macrolepiota fuliginosa MF-IS2]|uniref:Prokaryotic-type class I peptide chain release factors domain-containing protein n=1 Tax=Macrolepiota fuliginosa MF-IS2 TaxID=1400762 RepID=A0A9P5XMI7_9AGAR|nr:hypothetical protein P691DRAFT_697559 [Macrolepiota fuliginosa MF-IS2]